MQLALWDIPICQNQDFKEELITFISKACYEFEDESCTALWLCEDMDDYSMLKYWAYGPYDEAIKYISSLQIKEYSHILNEYEDRIGSIKFLKDRIVHKLKKPGKEDYLIAQEALATLILKEYQQIKNWQITYGVEHDFAIDLYEKQEKGLTPLLEGLDRGEYTTLSDMSSFYGCDVSTTVELPASLSDVFAHGSAKWDKELWEQGKEEREEILENKKENSSYSDKTQRTIYRDIFVPSFNPNIEVFEGVFSRWKAFNDKSNNINPLLYMKKLKECRPSEEHFEHYLRKSFLKYDSENLDYILSHIIDFDTWSDEESILKFLKEEYLYNCNLPYLIPISEKYFSIQRDILAGQRVMRVTLKVPGICNGEKEIRNVISKVYKFPKIGNTKEIHRILIDIAATSKEYLCGMEKERNKDTNAIKGLYPRRYHASHGLQYKKIFENMDMDRACEIAMAQSLYAIKTSLKYSDNPSLSCSFGNDSIFTLYLIRKVVPHIDIAFNNTGVNYAEVHQFRKELEEMWDLKDDVKVLKARKSYWDIKNQYGWNFGRKGKRKANSKGNKGSVSEICCNELKHKSMMEGIQQYQWTLNFTGIRGEESLSRQKSGKRDGLLYFAKTWSLFRCNPILFWLNSMIWYVVKRDSVPYCSIYDMVLYKEDEYGEPTDEVLYSPRCGCWCCVLTGSRGYFRWLKTFKRKQFDFIMKNEGLGELLYRLHLNLPVGYTEKGGVTLPNIQTKNTQPSIFDLLETTQVDPNENNSINLEDVENFDLDMVFNWIETRPCQIEKVLSKF